MNSEQTRALIDDFYTTLGRGDREHLLTLLDENVTWQMPSSVPDHLVEGRAAVAAELGSATVRRLFQRGTFGLEVIGVLVDGGYAAVQTATHATTHEGRRYEMQYCWVYTCADNRIQYIREYLDTLHAARVLGWLDDTTESSMPEPQANS